MLNCYPSKTGWMGVYLSRWSGDTLTGKPVDMAASAGLGQAAGKASSWPETNACCTGQSVPNASRKLPLSIPDFPYARMVSVASSGQQPEIISALYSTAATQSEVMEYYRKQMTYDGWRLISDQPHMASVLKERAPTVFGGREIAAGQLSFRGPQGTCLISTTESLGADPQAKDAKKEGKVKERTIIAINYMNLTLEGATRRIGKRRPAESNTGKDGLNNDTTNLQ